MTQPADVSALRARFRAAVSARKASDRSKVSRKGRDVLKTVKDHAKKDLETIEAVFLGAYDVVPVIEKIEEWTEPAAADDADF